MKKLLPFLLLSAFFFLPQSAFAGTLTEGCFPVVYCPDGQNAYGGSCQAELDSVSGAAPSCVSVHGVAPSDQSWGFSCDAGCYLKSAGVASVNPCPGGIMVAGTCLIKLNLLDDAGNPDAFGGTNPSYKIWDGAALTEVVHIGNAGCTDNQIAVSDSAEPTGWKCESKPTPLRDSVDGIIDFLETLMTELGVNVANITDIVTALTNLADGGTPVQIAQYKADLVTALAAFVLPPAGDVIWAGVTSASHDGKYANGYADADALCASNYELSRVCSVEEIMILRHKGELPDSVGGDEKAWINGGPPGFNSASNDCAGWKINDTTADNAWGRYWWFGLNQGWADGCNLIHRFACCN